MMTLMGSRSRDSSCLVYRRVPRSRSVGSGPSALLGSHQQVAGLLVLLVAWRADVDGVCSGEVTVEPSGALQRARSR